MSVCYINSLFNCSDCECVHRYESLLYPHTIGSFFVWHRFLYISEPSSKSSKTQTAYGFLAYWLTNLSPAESEAIVFSRTIFDKGSVYNNITGKFTAPVPGVYLLTASLCATSGSWIRLQFMADGARIGAFIVGDRDWFTCSSGSAIAFLEKGSTVWLRRVNVHNNTEKFANNNSDYFHSFTGLLIHETHPDSDN